jgi:predicted nucleic-acid-binding protein
MIGVDTNVLVRYLTQDDVAQAQESYLRGNDTFSVLGPGLS